METKTVDLNDDLLKGVSYLVKEENVDENTAIKQLMKHAGEL